MATARLPMRKAREILRQKLQCGLSHRQVAQSVGVGAGSVGDVMSRAKARIAELDWAKVQALSEDELQVALYGPRSAATGTRPMPDLALLHTELRRPGVTLALLHMEYLEKHLKRATKSGSGSDTHS